MTHPVPLSSSSSCALLSTAAPRAFLQAPVSSRSLRLLPGPNSRGSSGCNFLEKDNILEETGRLLPTPISFISQKALFLRCRSFSVKISSLETQEFAHFLSFPKLSCLSNCENDRPTLPHHTQRLTAPARTCQTEEPPASLGVLPQQSIPYLR